ncbi:hypothetical protein DFP72DRAFT_880690 [Ephemerocybe angulata]|uniref:Uncharacterized protein n=1 Tax=Ephemerocybe angulata TaxID=980116 RepID=A0A8H6IBA3_9AGAR|nr:hypothetical protein DFP72DRAFT_880690 [Tulosesus angulatus]
MLVDRKGEFVNKHWCVADFLFGVDILIPAECEPSPHRERGGKMGLEPMQRGNRMSYSTEVDKGGSGALLARVHWNNGWTVTQTWTALGRLFGGTRPSISTQSARPGQMLFPKTGLHSARRLCAALPSFAADPFPSHPRRLPYAVVPSIAHGRRRRSRSIARGVRFCAGLYAPFAHEWIARLLAMINSLHVSM